MNSAVPPTLRERLAAWWSRAGWGGSRRALRESELRHRSVIEVIEEAVLVRDRSEAIVGCNASAERILGLPRRVILGRKSLRPLVDFERADGGPLPFPDDHRAGLGALHEGRPEKDFVFALVRPDGTRVWISSNSHPVFVDGDPRPMFAVVSFADITRRKLAEDALRASEARYRSVINSLHEGVIVRDRDETFIACNRSAERILGLRASDILGRRSLHGVLRFVDAAGEPASPDSRRAGIVSLREGSSESEFVYGAIRPDGQLVWISSNAEPVSYDGESEPRGAVMSFTDITRQRVAEQQLRSSQALNRMLVQAVHQSNEAVMTRDLNGYVTSWNRGCERLYGFSAEEAIGRHLRELHQRHLSDREFDQVLARIRAGVPADGESVRLAKDGRRVVILSVSSPLHDDGGRLVGDVVSSRDISELRRTQAEVEELNRVLEQRVAERTAELEAVNQELEAFAYSVSHDLRSPLRAIDGFSELLNQHGAGSLDAQGQQYLGRVRAAAQRMGTLIDDLLKLSRVTRSEMNRRPVDLSSLVEAALSALAAEQPQRNVRGIVQPGLQASADPGLLRIVIENLVGNAWKFTSQRAEALIEFGQTAHEGAVAFFLRDNGAGFDMAYADRLFGAFQRLHSGSQFPGTGIGLATVQRIIHRHGGRIWANSAPDRGSTFYFVL